MGKIKVVTISGNFGAWSRTRVLIDTVVERIEAQIAIQRTDIVVGDLAPDLGALTDPKAIPPRVAGALAAITGADLLVVGSPVYKGAYTGLFKHLIDFIDPTALDGVPVVLTATGGSPRHALVIEHQLRPLFGFFLAHTIPTGLFAQDSDFTDYRLTNPEIATRAARAAEEAVRIVALGQPAIPDAA
ncbi:FMN reductase [Nitrospirillum sp. BR 11752]|uniref:FMN reductase n=1 Tax=Nitrospirillum sp. BR 11752 TaxID=3104293 RepID=UPI002EB98A1B|nr:FMN reductase [Nitrospirillum sp. BR 11752]